MSSCKADRGNRLLASVNPRYGDKFIGDWLDAKKHGDGELLYVNGDRFKVQSA